MQIQISWLFQKPTDLNLHCLLRQGMSCLAREGLTKICWSFYCFTTKTCWYSLEAPLQGTSNEYPQRAFSWGNKKNIFLIPLLSCAMEGSHLCCLTRVFSSDIFSRIQRFAKYRIHPKYWDNLIWAKSEDPVQMPQKMYLISVYTVCHSFSRILDTSAGSQMVLFKILWQIR